MKRASLAVHSGEGGDKTHGAVNTQIAWSTTYRYPELDDGAPSPFIYTRYANPTNISVEEKLAALEGAQGCLLFSSGMAAIAAVASTLLAPNMTVALQEGVYGGTSAFFKNQLAKWGVRVEEFSLDKSLQDLPPSDLIWVESITNPLVRVPNLPAIMARARELGAKVVVDATFATPMNQRPLELGADYVVHSATKAIGGHSDITAGAVLTNHPLDDLWLHRRDYGSILDPMAAYMIGRGAKTLPLRQGTQCKNALQLARAATAMDGIQAVHYPGLENHPDHDLVGAVVATGGSVVTIDVGTLDNAIAVRRNLKIIAPAASLGGTESLASLPLETSHAYEGPEIRAHFGITDGLIRISCGVEDVADLIADLQQAVATIAN